MFALDLETPLANVGAIRSESLVESPILTTRSAVATEVGIGSLWGALGGAVVGAGIVDHDAGVIALGGVISAIGMSLIAHGIAEHRAHDVIAKIR